MNITEKFTFTFGDKNKVARDNLVPNIGSAVAGWLAGFRNFQKISNENKFQNIIREKGKPTPQILKFDPPPDKYLF